MQLLMQMSALGHALCDPFLHRQLALGSQSLLCQRDHRSVLSSGHTVLQRFGLQVAHPAKGLCLATACHESRQLLNATCNAPPQPRLKMLAPPWTLLSLFGTILRMSAHRRREAECCLDAHQRKTPNWASGCEQPTILRSAQSEQGRWHLAGSKKTQMIRRRRCSASLGPRQDLYQTEDAVRIQEARPLQLARQASRLSRKTNDVANLCGVVGRRNGCTTPTDFASRSVGLASPCSKVHVAAHCTRLSGSASL